MNVQSTCPDSDMLKSLIVGNLAADVELDLQAHLETCDTCQQRLAAFVDGDDALPHIAKHLREPRAELDASVLKAGSLASQARSAAEETECQAERTAGISLDFLRPTQDEKFVGRFDKYDIIKVVGQGGMGVVLQAFDAQLTVWWP